MFIQSSNPFAENQIFGNTYEKPKTSQKAASIPAWKIVLGIVVFILGGSLIYQYFNSRKKKQTELAATQEENLQQGQLVKTTEIS